MSYPTPLGRFDALPRRRVQVAGGHEISAVDVGSGDPPVVLLHGNSTWSFQWRDVIPTVAAVRRCLAPDLLGFGRSDHPRIEYSWDVHYRAIAAFLDTLPQHSLVAHDWGAPLAVRYAIDHPQRVTDLLLLEPLILTDTWDDYQGERRKRFEAFLDRSRNVDLIEKQNLMVEEIRNAALRELSEDEMDGYRDPYPTQADRVPIRRFVEMKPIGEESETWDVFRKLEDGMRTLRVPVRLLTVDPGALMPPARVERLRGLVPHLEVEHLGPGRHHFPEDYAAQIAAAILR